MDDHVSVDDSPAAMLAGDAERDTVGASRRNGDQRARRRDSADARAGQDIGGGGGRRDGLRPRGGTGPRPAIGGGTGSGVGRRPCQGDRLAGRDGGRSGGKRDRGRQGTGVVTSTGADCVEAFPAASSAATLKAYSVPPDSPVTEADVPVVEATSVASRYTLYPVTPTSSVEALQETAISEKESARRDNVRRGARRRGVGRPGPRWRCRPTRRRR